MRCLTLGSYGKKAIAEIPPSNGLIKPKKEEAQMTKHYCDRCGKEIAEYNRLTGKIVADAGGRSFLTDSLDYELCARCKEALLTFLQGNTPISHGELVQMQKAKENER